MKIQRPNQSQLNIYTNQLQKQQQNRGKVNKQDQIQISEEAILLQKETKVNENRLNRIENIKNKIATGQYEIDFDKTASKMIEFWSKRK